MFTLFSQVSFSLCHSHSISLLFLPFFLMLGTFCSLPLCLLYSLSVSHIPFKDDLQVKSRLRRERSRQCHVLSGNSTRLYFEIHHVPSCGLTIRTHVGGGLKAGCWSGNHHVFMSTLILLANGIHVRQILTRISPPTHPPNCWDYVWQWRQVGGPVAILQPNTHTPSRLSSVLEKLSRAALGSGRIDHSLQTCTRGSTTQHSGMKSCET